VPEPVIVIAGVPVGVNDAADVDVNDGVADMLAYSVPQEGNTPSQFPFQ
jgi:hypothetical protein